MVRVELLYSCSDYDEFIATVLESSGKFLINDTVCVVLDYHTSALIDSGSCLDVLDKCVFKLPKNIDENDLPRILPIIKYGTFCCYIIQTYHICSTTRVMLDMPKNIGKVMMQFFKHKTSMIYDDHVHDADILVSYKNNIADIFQFNVHKVHIDFNFENLVDVFQKSNVEKVIQYILDEHMLADIVQLQRGDVLASSGSSRFFHIIEWKEICV